MTNLKKLMMTAAMMGIIITGLTSAKAGILLSDFTSTDAQTTTEAKDDKGVIVTFTGVIVTLMGVIVT